MPRTYDQHCGLARALDILGERWTMLIVRELTLGPKRFRDLVDRLPGAGTNLITARLRSLEEAGVIERATLPPPAGVQVYALTKRGEDLTPALEGLALWGSALLDGDTEGRAAHAAWAALSMRAEMEAEHRSAPDGVFSFVVDGEPFHVTVREGRAEVLDGPPRLDPDITVSCDLPTFFALATRQLTPARAVSQKQLNVEGERRRLDQLLGAFHLPERVGTA